MVVRYTISNIGSGNPFETYWRDKLVNLYVIFFSAVNVLSIDTPLYNYEQYVHTFIRGSKC